MDGGSSFAGSAKDILNSTHSDSKLHQKDRKLKKIVSLKNSSTILC